MSNLPIFEQFLIVGKSQAKDFLLNWAPPVPLKNAFKTEEPSKTESFFALWCNIVQLMPTSHSPSKEEEDLPRFVFFGCHKVDPESAREVP